MLNFALQSDSELLYVSFKQTKRLSTYLFALIAGGYMEYKNTLEGWENYPPMKAYCRKNLAYYFEYN